MSAEGLFPVDEVRFRMFPLTALGISASTLPLLLALKAGQSLQQKTLDWGQASEEIFRGERLPILPFPEPRSSER